MLALVALLGAVLIALALGVGAGTISGAADRAICALVGLLLVVAQFAGFISDHLPVRRIAALLAIAALTVSALRIAAGRRRATRDRSVEAVVCLVAGPALLTVYEASARLGALSAGTLDTLWRYAVEFPLCGLLAFVVLRGPLVVLLHRQLLALGLWSAVWAVVERLQGHGLFSVATTSIDFRNGGFRARVGAEHPLVLATFLLIAVPSACRLRNRPIAVSCVVLLAVGVSTTGSRGAELLLGVYLVYILLASHILRVRAIRLTLQLAVVLALIALALSGAVVNSVTGTDPDVASAEYRGALYGALITSLHDHPLGWGLSGLPHGALLISTSFGTLDIANTIDSEIVLAGLDFGILGLLLYLVVLGLPGYAPRNSLSAHSLTLVTLSGFYLALHAWAGLGAVWWLLIGGTAADVVGRRHATSQPDANAAPETSLRYRAVQP